MIGVGAGEFMRDLAVDPTSGDLVVTGDVHAVSGRQAVAQAIGIRLKTYRGEWFLDTARGVPWFDEIMSKDPNLVATGETLRREVSGTAGVLEVVAFSVALDRTTRTLSGSYTVTTDLGELVGTFTAEGT